MKGVACHDMFMCGLVLGASIGGLCSAFGGSPPLAMLLGADVGWACASVWYVLEMPAGLSEIGLKGKR